MKSMNRWSLKMQGKDHRLLTFNYKYTLFLFREIISFIFCLCMWCVFILHLKVDVAAAWALYLFNFLNVIYCSEHGWLILINLYLLISWYVIKRFYLYFFINSYKLFHFKYASLIKLKINLVYFYVYNFILESEILYWSPREIAKIFNSKTI